MAIDMNDPNLNEFYPRPNTELDPTAAVAPHTVQAAGSLMLQDLKPGVSPAGTQTRGLGKESYEPSFVQLPEGEVTEGLYTSYLNSRVANVERQMGPGSADAAKEDNNPYTKVGKVIEAEQRMREQVGS